MAHPADDPPANPARFRFGIVVNGASHRRLQRTAGLWPLAGTTPGGEGVVERGSTVCVWTKGANVIDRIGRNSRTRSLLLTAAVMGSLVLVSGASVASQGSPQAPAPVDAAMADQAPPRVNTEGRSVLKGEFDSPSVAAGSLVEGEASLFVPISSYRTYDSRNDIEGKWLVGDDFFLDVWNDQFGDPQIPDSATAVSFNVAAVDTEGRGFIQIYGPGTEAFSTSTVNWTQSGVNIANSGSTMLGEFDGNLGLMAVAVGGPAGTRTHIIIDITGYYI